MAKNTFLQGATLKRKIILKNSAKVAIPHANIIDAQVNIFGINPAGVRTLLKKFVKIADGGSTLLEEIVAEDGAYYFTATRAETALWAPGQKIQVEAWGKSNDSGSDFVMGLKSVLFDEVLEMDSKGDSI